jgi:hypothetical protein
MSESPPKLTTLKVSEHNLILAEKEMMKQRVKVIKLMRELNRPIENFKRMDPSLIPARHSIQHKLPDEIKLKKALKIEKRRLNDCERRLDMEQYVIE